MIDQTPHVAPRVKTADATRFIAVPIAAGSSWRVFVEPPSSGTTTILASDRVEPPRVSREGAVADQRPGLKCKLADNGSHSRRNFECNFDFRSTKPTPGRKKGYNVWRKSGERASVSRRSLLPDCRVGLPACHQHDVDRIRCAPFPERGRDRQRVACPVG